MTAELVSLNYRLSRVVARTYSEHLRFWLLRQRLEALTAER